MNTMENPVATPEFLALEDQLRMITSVFENANEGMMIMDANGFIRCVNPALCATTGYSVGELVGKSPAILKSGGHKDDFYAGIWKSFGGTGKWRGKIWSKRKNGDIYPTWLSISTILDSSGRLTQYMGISVDMSSLPENGELMETSSAITGSTAFSAEGQIH